MLLNAIAVVAPCLAPAQSWAAKPAHHDVVGDDLAVQWHVALQGQDWSAGDETITATALSPGEERWLMTGYARDLAAGTPGYLVARSLRAGSGEIEWSRLWIAAGTDTCYGTCIATSPDGERVYCGGWARPWPGPAQQVVVCFDAATGAELWSSATPGGGTADAVGGLAVSPDGATLYVAGQRTTAPATTADLFFEARDASSGQLLWEDALGSPAGHDYGVDVAVHPEGLFAYLLGQVASSIACPTCATASDLIVVGWDAATGARAWTTEWDSTLPGATPVPDHAGELELSADGSSLFVSGKSYLPIPTSGTSIVLNLSAWTGALRWDNTVDLGVYTGSATGMAVSPDDSRLVVTGTFQSPLLDPDGLQDRTVLYDAATGDVLWGSSLALGYDGHWPVDAVWSAARDEILLAATVEPQFGGPDTFDGRDALVAGLDPLDGSVTWYATYHGGSSAFTGDMAVDVHVREDDGAVLLAGLESVPQSNDLRSFATALRRPTLFGSTETLSVSAGGSTTFELEAGEASFFGLYLLLGSLSGTSPGLVVDDELLALNPDAYFWSTLALPNTPPLSSSLGLLGPGGVATATFTLPPASNPALAGLSAHHAFLVFQGLEASLASNAVETQLVP